MRIYLAARYSRRHELLSCRADLENLGHVVTSRWLNGDHELDDRGLSMEACRAERERFAGEDFDDVIAADMLIAFTEAPRSTNSRGGRHVEFGIALARPARVWIVGPRENVFHCLDGVRQFDDWASARSALTSETPATAVQPRVIDPAQPGPRDRQGTRTGQGRDKGGTRAGQAGDNGGQ